ncbi:MAG: tyrosine-type recombinase/integrase [Bdellovibrio sp.]|nr:tyrosine-type recombinase/integrase [Bdellovibrio sp.]
MNDQVRSLLKDLFLKRKSDYVFVDELGRPVDPHHLYRDFSKAQRRASLERHFRFHDLRHTFSSHFMMNGGNLYDLQKILGHSRIEMTMRYAHLSPDHLASAINVVNFGAEEKMK